MCSWKQCCATESLSLSYFSASRSFEPQAMCLPPPLLRAYAISRPPCADFLSPLWPLQEWTAEEIAVGLHTGSMRFAFESRSQRRGGKVFDSSNAPLRLSNSSGSFKGQPGVEISSVSPPPADPAAPAPALIGSVSNSRAGSPSTPEKPLSVKEGSRREGSLKL